MKETKQAKKNVKEWNSCFKLDMFRNRICLSHKQTCQRWLEFLERLYKMLPFSVTKIELKQTGDFYKLSENKMIDLFDTIKIYEENGI